ncbi:FAD dependent oxidoreductase [Athelia psychrophila]|uniref:FAD dependent oxidoreductase n=1 Tax=Athelia psychrophila TaxID=1759441 RepID=A0A167U1B4_9AGAM|nr:FAD dependent oxidoreductase [Fibularhizoctonia sp. CBS 109695]
MRSGQKRQLEPRYSTSSEYGDPLIQNSSSPSPHEKRILIVGSGCFGVSTAYHLLKRGYKDVTVVDRAETLPAADAATTDLNKIVGSAYKDVYYARLGQRAMEEWTTNEIWRPAYDPSGLVIVGYDDGFFDAAQASGADLVTITDAATLHAVYPPALQDGGLGTMIAPTATHSESAGSANAAKANELTIGAIRNMRGKMLTGKEACETLRDKSGQLTGVKFKDGSDIKTDYAVLATGAWTASAFPELGLDKFPELGLDELSELGLDKFLELGLEKLIFASGQSIATIKLPPDLAEVYRKCPISWAYNAGFYIFPPNDDDIVKISINNAGYAHTPLSAAGISTPRTFLTDSTAGLQILTKMPMAIRDALQQIYPKLAHLPFESTRLCWYAYSNDENWVIDEVENCKNLFVATAGSGHGFKES